jgi:peptidoglycan/xylan/chitin deacetylase (PgdA/CDA1 family)
MTILCYHAVETGWPSPLAIDPVAFAEQMAWLARKRTTIEATTAVERMDRRGRLPRGAVAITFDDGFVSVFDHAWPVLSRHRLPATVFVVAQTLSPEGRPVDWVDTPPPNPIRTLSLEQVLEMQAGGVTFGSHSFAHHDLTALSEDECRRDLADSRELLGDLLQRRVRFVAYPRGLHDEKVRRAAAAAGFTHGFALPERREPSGPFAVPRVGVYPGNGLWTLRAKTSQWYPALRTSRVFPAIRRMARGGRTASRRPPG